MDKPTTSEELPSHTRTEARTLGEMGRRRTTEVSAVRNRRHQEVQSNGHPEGNLSLQYSKGHKFLKEITLFHVSVRIRNFYFSLFFNLFICWSVKIGSFFHRNNFKIIYTMAVSTIITHVAVTIGLIWAIIVLVNEIMESNQWTK